MDDVSSNVRRMILKYQLKGYIFGLVVASTIWAVLVHFIPWTWLLVLVNIGFLLWTLGVVSQLIQTFKLALPTVVAWVSSLATWVLIVVIIRSLELTLLDIWF